MEEFCLFNFLLSISNFRISCFISSLKFSNSEYRIRFSDLKERLKILEDVVIQEKQPTLNRLSLLTGNHILKCVKKNHVKIQFDLFK